MVFASLIYSTNCIGSLKAWFYCVFVFPITKLLGATIKFSGIEVYKVKSFMRWSNVQIITLHHDQFQKKKKILIYKEFLLFISQLFRIWKYMQLVFLVKFDQGKWVCLVCTHNQSNYGILYSIDLNIKFIELFLFCDNIIIYHIICVV